VTARSASIFGERPWIRAGIVLLIGGGMAGLRCFSGWFSRASQARDEAASVGMLRIITISRSIGHGTAARHASPCQLRSTTRIGKTRWSSQRHGRMLAVLSAHACVLRPVAQQRASSPLLGGRPGPQAAFPAALGMVLLWPEVQFPCSTAEVVPMNNLEKPFKSLSRRLRFPRVFRRQSSRSRAAAWLAAPAAVAIMTTGCSSSAAPSSTASGSASSVATHFVPTSATPSGAQTGSSVLVPEGHTRPGERTTNEGNVAFSPDGRYAVIASGDLATPWLLDVSTRKEVREFKGHTDSVRSVAFSPDGHFIATASYDHTARLWDVASGKQIRVFAGHTDGVADVAFSPDGRQLLTGSFDGKAKLWDVATGRQVQQFDRHNADVVGVAFSPNGHEILTGSFDNTAQLCDVRSGAVLHTFPMLSGHWVALSPNGTYALIPGTGYQVQLWDLTSDRVVRAFSGHTAQLEDMAFSANGNYAVTGSQDDTARLWNVATGRQLQVFKGDTDSVPGVAISPNAQLVITSSKDGTVRLWKTGLLS